MSSDQPILIACVISFFIIWHLSSFYTYSYVVNSNRLRYYKIYKKTSVVGTVKYAYTRSNNLNHTIIRTDVILKSKYSSFTSIISAENIHHPNFLCSPLFFHRQTLVSLFNSRRAFLFRQNVLYTPINRCNLFDVFRNCILFC